jgi:lectin family protein
MRLRFPDAGGVLLLALLAGCSRTEPCRPGTLFLDLTMGGVATGADGLSIDVQTATGVLHDHVAYSGQSSFGLEVAFPGGYPSGQSVTVTVTAQTGTTDLASGMAIARLDHGCARLPVALGTITDLGSPPPCVHISGDFSQDPDPASWVLVGDAHADTANQRVALTDNRTDQQGALFYIPLVTMGGLDASFSLYMGSGSDGAALILTPSRPLSLPITAGAAGLGYDGLPGWAIEFDTYKNPDHGDADANHIAFMRAVDGVHLLAMPSPVSLPCDCARQVHLQLTSTHVHVDIDNMLGLDGDLPAQPGDGGVPMLAGAWTLGFTASAGGASAAHGIGKLDVAIGTPGSCF